MVKKKILFIRPTLGQGGADKVTLNLLRGFDRSKYEISLALMKMEGKLINQIPNDVPVIDLKKKSLWFTLPVLMKLFRKSDFDIFYCTSSGMSIPVVLSKVLSSSTKITVISERSSLLRRMNSGLKNKLILGLKKWLNKQSDFIVVVSEGLRNELLQLTDVSPNKIVVCNNPVIPKDLSSLMDQSELENSFNNAKTKILAVGRLVKEKDYKTLIKAFSVIEEESDATLFILGEGPLKSELLGLIASLSLDKKVVFLNFDVNPYKYLKKSDVFVMSSQNEGMPGTLIQAIACGTPSISTDCPTGPAEIIEDGQNGFLVPVGNYLELSKKILDLLNDEITKDKFKTNGPESVKRFREEHAISSYFSFIS
ncbi:MAG: glycosyltransferase [Bacteroidia bacterium]|nr:glycosyltransferase [Bacteroidia bacterium]NNJ55530.1 glycosyltransferase [Bacteroidia bacterium]